MPSMRALPVLLGALALGGANEPGLPGAGELLSAGAGLDRALSAGETHSYAVSLAAGEYLRVVVGQRNLDLAVRVLNGGKPLFEIDNPTGRLEPEVVSLVAATAGTYRLEIRIPAGNADAGRYRLTVDALRPATAEDRRRDAEEGRSFAEADRRAGDPAEPTGGLAPLLAFYEKGLAAARGRGDSPREAALLYRIGLVELRQGQGTAALQTFEEALALRRRLGDPRGTAGALTQLGRTYLRLYRLDRAAAAFAESVELWRELGEATEEGLASFYLGQADYAAGDSEGALAAYGRALERFRAAGNRRFEGLTLNALGGPLERHGRTLEAVSAARQALQVARELGHRDEEAEAENSLGTLADHLGRFHEAIDHYARAIDLYRDLRQSHRQGNALNNLGYVLWELGAPEDARQLCRQALPLVRQGGDRAKEVSVLINLGLAAKDLGQLGEAARRLEEALALARRIGDRPDEATALLTVGFLELARARPRQARDAFGQALQLVRHLDDRGREPAVLLGLGQAQADLRESAAAQSAWDEGLVKARAMGDVQNEALMLQEMARGARSRGDLAAARRLLEEALERLESLRAEVPGTALRTAHFAARGEVYEMYVDVLMQLHRAHPGEGLDALAFEAAERGRARGLLDLLLAERAEAGQDDLDLAAQERALKQPLDTQAGASQAAPADPRGRELEGLLTRLEARRQPAGPPSRLPGVRVSDFQRHSLDHDTLLLEYALGERRSYLWVVSTSTITSFELPGRKRIERLARQACESMRTVPGQDRRDGRAALAELSRLVLGPARRHLLAKRRWAVVADGALLSVPLAALPVPGSSGEPLVEHHEVVKLPSAAVLEELRRVVGERQRPAAALAVLADPVFQPNDPRFPAAGSRPAAGFAAPARGSVERWLRRGEEALALRLPWSGSEGEAIAGEARGGEVLRAFGFAASRELALAPRLRRYRIVHFATHGLVDGDHPELSGLLLSRFDARGRRQEGFLRLHEIYSLRLNADLVVLSGCQTALGRGFRGEGIVGLARGFFHAGAAQVLASLWSVRDRATAELMQRFYHALFHGGLRPSAALRAAQRSLRRQRAWRDPYFWAAFELQGDWHAGAPGPGTPVNR